jgi:hypothetical protein
MRDTRGPFLAILGCAALAIVRRRTPYLLAFAGIIVELNAWGMRGLVSSNIDLRTPPRRNGRGPVDQS